jgi:hypothetical protein
VGDKQFAREFKRYVHGSLRFVHEYDPVPSFPSSWRFQHVHGELWLTTTQQQLQEQSTPRWRRVCTKIMLNIFGRGSNSVIDDHSCDQYVQDIQDRYGLTN